MRSFFLLLLALVSARTPLRGTSDWIVSDVNPPSSSSSSPAHTSNASVVDGDYLLGVGIADVTGPAADVSLMGYAAPEQIVDGIHMRLRSRAFIFADAANPNEPVVYVIADIAMAGQLMKQLVVEEVARLIPNSPYRIDNFVLQGTHTHSNPGGFLDYVMYIATNLGYWPDSLQAIVTGVARSIVNAHRSIVPGRVFISTGLLRDSSINRSPTSYQRNPAEERAQYSSNVDEDFVLLRLEDRTGRELGALSWFAVHTTSINNTNTLIDGDNKGAASYMFEQWKNPNSLPGKGSFVAGFAQANHGDTSPNLDGPYCIDTGLPCDTLTSTCPTPEGQRSQNCIAMGPGRTMYESSYMIGHRQYSFARNLYETASETLSSSVSYAHTWVNITNIPVPPNSGGLMSRTCKSAMGYSFAAGTTDGPGFADFFQGQLNTTLFWELLTPVLSVPTLEERLCQFPKPILLNTGTIYIVPDIEWQPSVVPFQVIKLGRLVIAPVPCEMTVMGGRRMKTMLRDVFGPDVIAVIGSTSNSYSSYVTTFEEYQAQRYEAGSTPYGPHTLRAYLQEYRKLAEAIREGRRPEPGPTPPDYRDILPSLIIAGLPPPPDTIEDGNRFGDVIVDTRRSYVWGETASATFWSASPRNDLLLEESFSTVERFDVDSRSWVPFLDDGAWDTSFRNYRTPEGYVHSSVEWLIAESIAPPEATLFRLCHQGTSHLAEQPLQRFRGCSSEFDVRRRSTDTTRLVRR